MANPVVAVRTSEPETPQPPHRVARRLWTEGAGTSPLWTAGSVSRDKKRAQALAYAEPRVYEDRLNAVLGPDWSCRFITWGEQRLLCELSVTVSDGAGGTREVTRTSTGEFDSGDRVARGTAAEAQAVNKIWYGQTADGTVPDPLLDNAGSPALASSRCRSTPPATST